MRQSDREFLTTARRFVADAEPLAQEFIKYELPTDFLDDLRAGIEAIRDLDAVVRNRYRNDPATLAAWTNATHVARQPRVAKAKVVAA